MVRPLKSGILYNWSLPKSAVFSRVSGVWNFRGTGNGNCVPNVALYQAEPHLGIKLFFAFFFIKKLSLGHKHSRLWHCRVLYSLFIPLSRSLYRPPDALALQAPRRTTVLYHENLLLSSNFRYVFSTQRAKEVSFILFSPPIYQISYRVSSGSEFLVPFYAFQQACVCA